MNMEDHLGAVRVRTAVDCVEGFGLMHITPTVSIWVVVKMMVPFWVPIIVRHLIFRVPKKGP